MQTPSAKANVKHFIKTPWLLALLAAGAIALPATASARPLILVHRVPVAKLVVKPARPAVVVKIKPVAVVTPAPKKVWINGHWKRDRLGRRVWKPGHWKVVR